MGEEKERNLTDGDVQEIVSELEHRILDRFFTSVGRGIWSLAWKGILLGMVGLAAYGYFKNPH